MFKQNLSKIVTDIDLVLDKLMPSQKYNGDPAEVARYATIGKGKRLRPFLTVTCANLFGVPYEIALSVGACLEMVHNFSLIHDDMPCIDNDTLRNGRPSAWAKYGEWRALLGGDALLNLPYKVLATDERISSEVRCELIEILSEATHGMIVGEFMDVEAEQGNFHSIEEVNEIQSLKTGQLFYASAQLGAALGHAGCAERTALKNFTNAMGLCFQITDDILDATGDETKVGKTLNKDASAGKATYVSLLGLDNARSQALDFANKAKFALNIFDERADVLRELMDYMVSREA